MRLTSLKARGTGMQGGEAHGTHLMPRARTWSLTSLETLLPCLFVLVLPLV